MSRSTLDILNDYQYHRPTLFKPKEKQFCSRHSYIFPVIIIMIIVVIVLFYPMNPTKVKPPQSIKGTKTTQCDIQLVETLPAAINYTTDDTRFLSTFEAWKWLLDNAKTNIDISSLYWNMQNAESNLSHGDYLYQKFLAYRLKKAKLQLRIAEHRFFDRPGNNETLNLAKSKAADVVYINFQKHFEGILGLLHTKLWIVDKRHFYIGSADMDWRSLIQTKELGVLAKNCPQLAKDVSKIFETYWYLGSNPNKKLPGQWPEDYNTLYNASNPLPLTFNSKYTGNAYFSSSPPSLPTSGRTHDLDAILNAINSANSYINIAVMDYYPLIIYAKRIKYWPYIDDALRQAAVERNVFVKLLISWWKYSNPFEDYFLRSLQDLSHILSFVDLEVRRFVVPENEAAVNHNKYFVTENIAYIGTSNWSGDFLTNSAGIGLVLNDTQQNVNTLRTDLLKVFIRDWESPYAFLLRRHDKF